MDLDNLDGSVFGEHFGDRTTYTGTGSDISTSKAHQITNDMGGEYASISDRIREFGQDFDKKNAESKTPITFNSKEEMLRQVKLFFSLINPTLGERMNAVINNYMIQKDIVLIKEGACQSVTSKNGDYLKMELRITPDGKGLIALAQEISNAYIYGRFVEQKKEEEKIKAQQISKTASKFFSLLLIEHLADKLPTMTREQKESLQFSALNNKSINMFAEKEDEVLFNKIMEENPDRFLNCNTPEDYIIAFNQIVDNPESHIFGEEVSDRVEEIAAENPGEYLGTKEVVDEIAEEILNNIALEGAQEFYANAQRGETKNLVLNIVNGAYVTQKLMEKGYTQEQLNNDDIKNKITELNKQAQAQLESTPHPTLEQIQAMEMEREDNVPVMEMKRNPNYK